MKNSQCNTEHREKGGVFIFKQHEFELENWCREKGGVFILKQLEFE